MKPSRVLATLRSGEPAFCVKTNFADPRIVELMGLIGFDCVWLCREHIPNDWALIESQIRAAALHGMDSLVRVSKGSYSDYIRPLEANAEGIMVPHLMSRQEASELVRMTRFSPLGRRPVDGGNADGDFCLTPPAEYMRTANRERFVVAQIEDPEPLDELDAIAAVQGIDMLFFGPGDFSHALGIPGQYGHPDVAAARRAVADACRRHGKFAGTVTAGSTIPELLDEGFAFINIGSDVGALGKALKDMRESIRPFTRGPREA